ncbi:MAG: hypothetical protein GXP28_01425, partial [Planctomycetes bacterium]|nr:hypothetical protein [Planctomycetota bacterium]
MNSTEQYQRYSAPEQDGQVLSVPPWNAVGQLLESNQAVRASQSADIQGRSLRDLSAEARQSTRSAALAYTRAYADVDSPGAESPLVLTGHQPELVHPGVWLKDFATSRIAGQARGTALSLIIDSDLCRSPSIRVPTGTSSDPRVESVAYDRWIDPIPLEQRTILDRASWDSFGSRVSKTIRPLVSSPLIAEWWPEQALSWEASNLGQAIARARHRLELQWGNRSLCLPQSQVCQTDPFRWFAVHLLANALRFRRAYNGALAEYRREHRLRNHAQPTPNLAEIEGWTETPFWIWTSEDPRRRGLFVQQKSDELFLTDRAGFERSLPLSPDAGAIPAIEKMADWESLGIKIRSRALITTMYARLVLADLFIHGIGGAKYDQVTDVICEQFFGFSPAAYLTLSGTLRLPIEHPSVAPTREQQLRQELREFSYHPETKTARLALGPEEQAKVDVAIAQKNSWVQTPKTRANAAERHRKIVEANRALQEWLTPRRAELDRQLATTARQIKTNRVLKSREYS